MNNQEKARQFLLFLWPFRGSNQYMFSYSRIFIFAVTLFTGLSVSGQLCTGSLGDPVVNITFGSGTNTGNNFTPPVAYTYTTSTCPNDGSYTITGFTSACFGGNWHDVGQDHTGNGNFMLVNASYTPGDFFKTTVSGLCPNTTYEFAAWIMNVLKNSGIKPDLTFRIEKTDGTVLGQYSTGPLMETPSPVWTQYGFFFTTPPDNPDVVIRITNNAPGGNGNDLALDDITFRPCGPAVTASIVGVTGDLSVCEYDQPVLTLEADPSGFYLSPSVQWQVSLDSGKSWTNIPGATGINYTRMPGSPGHYWYRFNVAESGSPAVCRINSNILVCNIWPRPLVNAGPDRTLLLGDTLQMTAVADPTGSYQWTPGQFLSDPMIVQPRAWPRQLTTYQLQVVSANGCVNEDEVTIRIIRDIFIPTAFTPNNDGLNDQWRIPSLDPVWGAEVQVFNRYGQIIYSGRGAPISWDGTTGGLIQPSGIYIYLLKIPSKGLQRKGTITLIR